MLLKEIFLFYEKEFVPSGTSAGHSKSLEMTGIFCGIVKHLILDTRMLG